MRLSAMAASARFGFCLLLGLASPAALRGEVQPHPLLGIMQSELDLSMQKLESADGVRPYFIQYSVHDRHEMTIQASLGSQTYEDVDHTRSLDVEVRCGDYTLDNTHQIRGGGYWGPAGRSSGTRLPLNDDPTATRHEIWLETDEVFKSAVKRLADVKANVKVKVEEEDKSDDFSKETPAQQLETWVVPEWEAGPHRELIKSLSRRFRSHPLIYNSGVSLSAEVYNRLEVNSEGSRIQLSRPWWRISVRASTIAEDGMQLWQSKSADSHSFEGLPDRAALEKLVDDVIHDIEALRQAPIVDPYTGPAILLNRASGVFFHEIFGHRIEGHRQKDVEEGQTFAKKIGQPVLPAFLTVVDDPSQKSFNGIDLNGYYQFDNECIPAQPARLVEEGVLKTFLLSRSPTRGFTRSNGHGRGQPGGGVVARQGNLIVESTKSVPFDKLRLMLIDECKKQNKEYGLLFEDISGGFTTTGRRTPQSFKVLPIMVYRVYADGRPDELVRGVDIVGTPLTCFSKILATGDDPDVFNGVCGAESGSVPVSAISPSILVEQIEIEKKQKAQDRPPILPPPIAGESGQDSKVVTPGAVDGSPAVAGGQ